MTPGNSNDLALAKPYDVTVDTVTGDTPLPTFTIIRPYLRPPTNDVQALSLLTPMRTQNDPSSITKGSHADAGSGCESAVSRSEDLRQRLLASSQQMADNHTSRKEGATIYFEPGSLILQAHQHPSPKSPRGAIQARGCRVAGGDVPSSSTLRQSSPNTELVDDQHLLSHFEEEMAVTPRREYQSDDDPASDRPPFSVTSG